MRARTVSQELDERHALLHVRLDTSKTFAAQHRNGRVTAQPPHAERSGGGRSGSYGRLTRWQSLGTWPELAATNDSDGNEDKADDPGNL